MWPTLSLELCLKQTDPVIRQEREGRSDNTAVVSLGNVITLIICAGNLQHTQSPHSEEVFHEKDPLISHGLML